MNYRNNDGCGGGFSKWEMEKSARDALVHELLCGSNEARRLANKMRNCGSTSRWTNNTSYCWQPACPRCRRAHGRKQANQVKARFNGASKDDLALVTVLLGVADTASDVPSTWNAGRKALANRIAALRSQSKRWNSVNLVGWMEADPYSADQVPLMNGRMRTYLDMEGPLLGWDGNPAWIVHIHMIVHHPQLDWQQVRDGFVQQWPAPHAVDVQPCNQAKYAGQDVDEALSSITAYAHKYTTGRTFWGEEGSKEDVHPAAWMARLHEALHSTSTGFKSWRKVLSPRRCEHPISAKDISPHLHQCPRVLDDENGMDTIFCSIL